MLLNETRVHVIRGGRFENMNNLTTQIFIEITSYLEDDTKDCETNSKLMLPDSTMYGIVFGSSYYTHLTSDNHILKYVMLYE